MPEIKISVANRIAKADKDAVIVCGNSDYAVVFNFDEEWVGLGVKTALFAYNGEVVPVVFTGSVCVAPVIEGTTAVGIGVASGNLVDGEIPKLQTTTAAFVPCLFSIKDESGEYVAPPTPAVYDEIIALLNKYIGQSGTSEERVREIVAEETAGLQPKTDESLPTQSKEIVGAIKELYEREDKQGLSREQVEGIVDDKISTEIPDWAKEPTKPSYTASEVGALPSDTPLFSGDYNDLTNKPQIPSMEGVATEEYVDGLVGDIEIALDEIIAIQNSLIGTPFEELHEYAQSLIDGGEV